MNDCVPQRAHSFVIPDWIKIQIDVTDYPLKDPILILLYLDVTVLSTVLQTNWPGIVPPIENRLESYSF